MTSSDMERLGTVSKIDHYGWTVKDEPGRLMWIPKNELLIDSNYQRTVRPKRALTLASSWSWVACGCLIVAEREDARFYVMDGGHRLAAAKRRSDITELPCVVFKVISNITEAQGFLDSNINRRPMFVIERFRALLTVGDEVALLVNDLIKDTGREPTISSGPNTIACIGAMMKAASDDSQSLVAIWPIIILLCNKRPIPDRIVQGLVYLEGQLYKQCGESLTDTRWRGRILQKGYDAIINGIGKASAYHNKGGAKVYAGGIVDVINKGLQHKMNVTI